MQADRSLAKKIAETGCRHTINVPQAIKMFKMFNIILA
jgi:hypothetical protein